MLSTCLHSYWILHLCSHSRYRAHWLVPLPGFAGGDTFHEDFEVEVEQGDQHLHCWVALLPTSCHILFRDPRILQKWRRRRYYKLRTEKQILEYGVPVADDEEEEGEEGGK